MAHRNSGFHVPSGYVKIAIEHSHRQFVDLYGFIHFHSMVIFHSYVNVYQRVGCDQKKWWVPEIGVPPFIIHFNGIFHYKTNHFRYPHYRNPMKSPNHSFTPTPGTTQ